MKPCTPIHLDREVCKFILSNPTASVPLDIGKSPVPYAGTGLFTKVDLKYGQEIFRSEPLIHAVSGGVEGAVCDNCFATRVRRIQKDGNLCFDSDEYPQPTFTQCPGCKMCYYCSEDCMHEAWKTHHQTECGLLASEPECFKVETRLLFRLLRKHKTGQLKASQWRVLASLCTNETYYRERDAIPLVDVTTSRLITESPITQSEVEKIYCTLLTNTIPICHAEGGSSEGGPVFGRALDLTASLINHDCEPNAFIFFEGKSLRVHALKRIEAGSEITVCYANSILDLTRRRAALLLEDCVECYCGRCRREEGNTRLSDDSLFERRIFDAHDALIALIHVVARPAPTPGPDAIDKAKLFASRVAKATFYRGEWPNCFGIFSVAQLHIARCDSLHGRHLSALKRGFGAVLGTVDDRWGPAWCNRVFVMVLILHRAYRWMRDEVAPEAPVRAYVAEEDLHVVLVGWLRELAWATHETFGAKVSYAVAVRKCYQGFVKAEPRPRTNQFAQLFEETQIRLLDFLRVPSKGTPTELIGLKLSH